MLTAGSLIALELWLVPDGIELDGAHIPRLILYGIACLGITMLELGVLAFLTFRAASRAAGHARLISAHVDDDFVAKTARASVGLGDGKMLARSYGVRLNLRQKLAAMAIAAAWNLRKTMSKRAARFLVGRLATRSVLRAYSALIAAPLIGITACVAMVGSVRDLRRHVAGRMVVGALVERFHPERLDPASPLHSIIVDMCHLRMRSVGQVDVNLVHFCQLVAMADPDIAHWPPQRMDWPLLSAAIARLPQPEADLARAAALVVMALHGRRLSRSERQWLADLGLEAASVREVRRRLTHSRPDTVITEIEMILPPAEPLETVEASSRIAR